MKAELLFLFT